MLNLFLHQWLETKRSLFWQKSVFVNILSGIMGLYFLINFLLLGFYADDLIQSVYQESNTIRLFSGFILFYYLFDLFARFMVQKNTVLSIQPYLILPVSKQSLLHYPLVRSIFSFLNVLALCLIIPYFVKVVVPGTSPGFASSWFATLIALMFINNFIIIAIKKLDAINPILISIFIVSIGSLLYLNFTDIFSLSTHFSAMVFFIAEKPIMVVIPIMLLAISYYFAFSSLRKGLYSERPNNREAGSQGTFSFLTRRGQVANLLAIELKMIFRNKRPKTALLYGVLMIPYGLLLLQNKADDYFLILFIGFMIISSIPTMYAQLVFSWESSYLDGYLTNNVTIVNYLKSKYLLIGLLTITSYLLALPLVFVHPELLKIHTAMLFYTIGVSSTIILTLGCFKRKPISLAKNQMINYEGLSIVEFLMIFPLLGLPSIIYFILNAYDQSAYAEYGIGLVGLAGIVFNHQLLQAISRLFVKNKYAMGQGFRKN